MPLQQRAGSNVRKERCASTAFQDISAFQRTAYGVSTCTCQRNDAARPSPAMTPLGIDGFEKHGHAGVHAWQADELGESLKSPHNTTTGVFRLLSPADPLFSELLSLLEAAWWADASRSIICRACTSRAAVFACTQRHRQSKFLIVCNPARWDLVEDNPGKASLSMSIFNEIWLKVITSPALAFRWVPANITFCPLKRSLNRTCSMPCLPEGPFAVLKGRPGMTCLVSH